MTVYEIKESKIKQNNLSFIVSKFKPQENWNVTNSKIYRTKKIKNLSFIKVTETNVITVSITEISLFIPSAIKTEKTIFNRR